MGKGGRIVSERCVVDLVDKDTEEGGGLVVRVRLKLGIDFDDERGGDGREQTSLQLGQHAYPTTIGETHEDQSGV